MHVQRSHNGLMMVQLQQATFYCDEKVMGTEIETAHWLSFGGMENPYRHRGEDDLSSDMQQALEDGSLCDVTFAVGEGDDLVLVPGIRAVLAARCVVMRRMLFSSMREGSEDQVVMPAFSPAPFSKFIAFLHTGSLVVETKDVCELLQLASFFQREDVMDLCVKFMEENCITIGTFTLSSGGDIIVDSASSY